MKILIVISAYLHICAFAHSQCVEVDRFFTGGLHYLTGKKATGFQLEVGSTGSESNISYYAIVTGYQKRLQYKDSAHINYPGMAIGLKGAYRFVRVQNAFNLYITTCFAQDLELGLYNASSIKLLASLGRKVALSVEPSYLLKQKSFMAQAGINIILD